jgi:hypothetical protein
VGLIIFSFFFLTKYIFITHIGCRLLNFLTTTLRDISPVHSNPIILTVVKNRKVANCWMRNLDVPDFYLPGINNIMSTILSTTGCMDLNLGGRKDFLESYLVKYFHGHLV